MPCLDISTNVNLNGVDLDSVFSEATKTVAAIMGKPETVRANLPSSLLYLLITWPVLCCVSQTPTFHLFTFFLFLSRTLVCR
mgnify:CR=1 FL=1